MTTGHNLPLYLKVNANRPNNYLKLGNFLLFKIKSSKMTIKLTEYEREITKLKNIKNNYELLKSSL